MLVSVIICAYTEKRWDELVDAVESVRSQTIAPAEIILVIDHNPSLFQRSKAFFPDTTIVTNREMRGLSGARNSGVAAARGDILAFMDEDAIAEPDWLAWLLKGYSNPQVLGVGGAILPWWMDRQANWFPEEFNWVVGCTYPGLPQAAAPVRNLIGANMSIRSEVFQKVGGFTHGVGRVGTLPMGCEETELCIRAAQQITGGFFVFEPRARVHHRVPPARMNWRYFVHRCYAEGVSKAKIVRVVGPGKGLSNERSYTFRILPLGVLSGMEGALFRSQPQGAGRALAIVAGFLCTSLGYVHGTLMEIRGANGGRKTGEVTKDHDGTMEDLSTTQNQ